MFILLPSESQGVQLQTVNGRKLFTYLPVAQEIIEVEDLWYERRKGPSSTDLLRHRMYGTDLPRRGRYSALCHAKPRLQNLTWSGDEPDDAYSLGAMITYASGKWDYCDYPKQDGVYYHALMQYAVITVDGRNAVRQTHLYLRPSNSQFELLVGDYVYNRAVSSLRFEYGCYSYSLKVDRTEDNRNPQWWTTEKLRLVTDALVASKTPSYSIQTASNHYYKSSVDSSYVTTQVSNAISSALRYRDTELVDYSVDALSYNYTPWALGSIDFITGKARAFIEATNDIPLLSENSLQNLASATSALKSFCFGRDQWDDIFDRFIKDQRPQDWYLSKARNSTRAQKTAKRIAQNWSNQTADIRPWLDSFGDAWLKGRYAFSTSISDLGSAWQYFYDIALQEIGRRSGDYKCHGESLSSNDTEFACTFTARERALEGVVKAFEHCYRLGVEPNAYVLWDFVPFSFVIDWFLPVGDALNAYTRASHFTPEYWEFQDIYDGKSFCYSVRYCSETNIGPVDVYTRWYESSPPEVQAAYFLESPHKTSKKTTCMRLLDGIALFC